LRLSNKIELTLIEDYESWFDEITTFNLSARYDNYKNSFYKLCTPEFTKLWFERIIELRKWLINQL